MKAKAFLMKFTRENGGTLKMQDADPPTNTLQSLKDHCSKGKTQLTLSDGCTIPDMESIVRTFITYGIKCGVYLTYVKHFGYEDFT